MTRIVLIAVLLMAVAAAGFAQAPPTRQEETVQPLGVARGKKLILKDGSFHIVRDWELQPDPTGQGNKRVRYYSVERSRYEELPADLVDFEATRQAELAMAQREAAVREELEAGRVAQLAAEIDVDASLEIAPGIFLPDGDGLYVFDPATNLLLPLTQVSSDVKLDKGRLLTQILVPIPTVPGRHRVVVSGKSAVLRLTTDNPEFYIRTADSREPEMELIRAKVKGNKREIEVIDTSAITGEEFRDRQTVSVQRTPIARGVYRLSMSQSLPAGEYVLAEFLPGEGMNLYVWDFGVDSATKPAKKK